MPDWLIWFVAAVAVTAVVRRGCGTRACGPSRLPGGRETRAAAGHPRGEDARRPTLPEGDGRPAAAKSPLARLQREFVDGTLTLEEYERELDALDRIE